MNTILKIEKLTKRFGGLTAIGDVSISVSKSHIHSLIGPNGAGKTTLFNLISRILKPDSGKIVFRGQDLLKVAPSKIVSLGISRTFQAIELFDDMTVLENVLLGCHTLIDGGPIKAAFRFKSSVSNEAAARERCLGALQLVGMENYPKELAGSLSLGRKRLLELARALVIGSDLLLLDEPASGLSTAETTEFMDIIRNLRDERNITILLVEHDMRVVMEISDIISVLNHGIKIAEGGPDEIKSDAEVIEAYLGAENQRAEHENATC